MAEQGKDSFKRMDYLTPIEKDTLYLLDVKQKVSNLYGEMYQWKLLGRQDPRLTAEFTGEVMKLYRLVRAKMYKSDISEEYPSQADPSKMETHLIYKEAVEIIDRYEKKPSSCTPAIAIEVYKLVLDFIEDSGLLLRNMPRYVI